MSEGFEAGCMDSTILEHSFLRMNQLRSQAHVAQQSRHEKLRVQNSPSSPQLGSQSDTSGYSNYILHQAPITSTVQQQTKNCESSRQGYQGGHSEIPMYDGNMISSEMFNFPIEAELLGVPPKGTMVLQQAQAASSDDGSDRPSLPYAIFGHHPGSNLSAIKTNVGTANLGSNWKSLNAQSNNEWPVKHIQGIPNAVYGGQNSIATTLFGGLQSGILKDGSITTSPNIHGDAMQLYLMNPGYAGYPETTTSGSMQHSSNEIANQGTETQKHLVEVPVPPNFPPFQQTALPLVAEVGTSSQGLCIAQIPSNLRESGQWPNGGNELVLLPAYGNIHNGSQYMSPRYSNAVSWANRQGGSLQWNPEHSFDESKAGEDFRTEQLSMGRDRSGQGLSLSLSSHHPSLQQLDAMASHRANVLQVATATEVKAKSEELFNNHGANGSTGAVPGYVSSYSRDENVPGKGYVAGGSTMELHMNVGNLGPFGGYATVLKNSKYLKPAQELLDEFCNVGRGLQTNNMLKQKISSRSEDWVDRNLVAGSNAVENNNGMKSEIGGKIVNSCTQAATSSSTYASGETPNESAMGQTPYSGDRFEIQRRKTKLSSMLEEVHRRYRQYCEQMHMVKASFESIAGMGSATPYTKLALKAMSRHFRCLRDAISNQLRAAKKALGEDCSGPGTSRGETPRLRFLDQSLRQQRAVQHLGMLEQHAWRPQRGLPERSVSVLRAWLFEHFLHPYPTDADKHMLARQTGLSRSQVSNWFINARVRLWKPMVEDMYLQEIKEASDMDVTTGKRKENESRDKTESPLGEEKNMNKHGKIMLDGGVSSDKQSASECEGSKVDHGGSTSQTGQESSGTALSIPLDSQFRSGDKVDGTREADMDVNLNRINVGSLSSVNAGPTIGVDRKLLDETHGCINFEQGMKRFRNDLDRNRFQGFDNTVNYTYSHESAGMGGRYSHEELTPRQIGSHAGVSLTLGLRHSGGQEKYNNGLYLSRDDSAPDTNHHFNIHHHGNDQGYGNHGFDTQNIQFRKHVESQLLHDFVG
ncbi:hypothetical protein SUGI_0877060 [Cryptomeria japonica]|uniref:BEL1-like homeodomain protein 4 n=1 Tax=Cryptomeria japonica TaxID=3369 RepID=UPI002414BFD3|nr:BEL1-like homeodomain protein 4 [Cryptomeria japonica]XP_057819362.2 BEL1-like homeodomain protein 4 [Cryptomeria japonica]XP_057819363.2 BEL1-like homeodomain protein 4 [Cryptomeria japonica]XP_057819364.2 BEL1-like homeodomain protein 4 [Cryptomeria japonica]GLJ42351.1 hypothetical protein SUGI_0877060 [Cryptomeria japonica]